MEDAEARQRVEQALRQSQQLLARQLQVSKQLCEAQKLAALQLSVSSRWAEESQFKTPPSQADPPPKAG
jgi:hypothetical protein